MQDLSSGVALVRKAERERCADGGTVSESRTHLQSSSRDERTLAQACETEPARTRARGVESPSVILHSQDEVECVTCERDGRHLTSRMPHHVAECLLHDAVGRPPGIAERAVRRSGGGNLHLDITAAGDLKRKFLQRRKEADLVHNGRMQTCRDAADCHGEIGEFGIDSLKSCLQYLDGTVTAVAPECLDLRADEGNALQDVIMQFARYPRSLLFVCASDEKRLLLAIRQPSALYTHHRHHEGDDDDGYREGRGDEERPED